MVPSEVLGKVLGVDRLMLEGLDATMTERTGRPGVMARVAEENQKTIEATLIKLNHKEASAAHVRSILRKTIFNHEGELLRFSSVAEAIKKYDVTELFSSLRFVESDEWMHQTFDEVYSSFKPSDFEEREIEVRVLGPEWKEISEKFVAKKHHNVSHLKEFGIIFLNPVSENIPGKFLRDFALFLHYFHEISFYAKLFRQYSADEATFADKLKSLLRGDVPEIYKVMPGEWLIVQRYLYKVNHDDPRLFLPRVNPESIHWLRGERDLTLFRDESGKLDLSLWHDLDWVGGIFDHGDEEVVSFDLEDNAMSLVSFMEGQDETFFRLR